jgi:hypothetical protein
MARVAARRGAAARSRSSDAALKAEWLRKRPPRRGGRQGARCWSRSAATARELVELARKNAAVSFASRRNARADAELTLAKLQKRLRCRSCRA